jgi:hypothetical protein
MCFELGNYVFCPKELNIIMQNKSHDTKREMVQAERDKPNSGIHMFKGLLLLHDSHDVWNRENVLERTDAMSFVVNEFLNWKPDVASEMDQPTSSPNSRRKRRRGG